MPFDADSDWSIKFRRYFSLSSLLSIAFIKSSKEITLSGAINKLFDIISCNPFYGENAKKSLIPKEYIQKYDADNLFIADLPDYWRMIYTIESDEIEIIAFVLDIINHKEYDKKFKYRKK